MPENIVKVIGKSFQADYSRNGTGWKCNLTSLTGGTSVDGWGDSEDQALSMAKEKAAEAIRKVREEINEMIFKDEDPPTEEEMRWADERIRSVMNE